MKGIHFSSRGKHKLVQPFSTRAVERLVTNKCLLRLCHLHRYEGSLSREKLWRHQSASMTHRCGIQAKRKRMWRRPNPILRYFVKKIYQIIQPRPISLPYEPLWGLIMIGECLALQSFISERSSWKLELQNLQLCVNLSYTDWTWIPRVCLEV